jgi:hypothetical protein
VAARRTAPGACLSLHGPEDRGAGIGRDLHDRNDDAEARRIRTGGFKLTEKVLLVDFDSKIPNLALMKISAYEKARGSVVGFDAENPDKVICSVIFTKNRAQAEGLKTMFSCPVEFGGSGWDLTNRLPPEVELIKPDYDLYPSEYSQGYTTRGCIRKCGFCIVPEKEGALHPVQHPAAFHDDRFGTCMIMDNNLLGAKKEWVKSVLSWFHEGRIKMLSPQGWDARLLTEEYAGMLKDIRQPKGIHFAWDSRKDEPAIIKAISLLKNAGFNLRNDVSFYVLAGYDSTFEDDLYRCNRLKEMGVNAFVMPYHKRDSRINRLANWANRRWAYWSGPFQEVRA